MPPPWQKQKRKPRNAALHLIDLELRNTPMPPMTYLDWHKSAQRLLDMAAKRRIRALDTRGGKPKPGPYWKLSYRKDLIQARIRRLAKQGVYTEVEAFTLLNRVCL